MSNCNDCYGGCMEIIPDQCIKYTGLPIEFLDILPGDSLSSIEDKIITYLTTVLDGAGIHPTIDLGLCELITTLLPVTSTITLNQLLNTLSVAICTLQTQVTAVDNAVTAIDAEYETGCLVGISSESDTHEVLQTVINQLCQVINDVSTLTGSLEGYVLVSDVNSYIEAYLVSTVDNKVYKKMIPYVAIEFYGDTTGKFDSNGVGYGDWEQVYLCNGYYGITPDKRGRIPVGTTTMGTGIYTNGNTNPALGNPTYALGALNGTNTVTLTESTLPSHTHTVIEPNSGQGHKHVQTVYEAGSNGGTIPAGFLNVGIDESGAYSTQYATTGITLGNKGEGSAHNNIPPVLACHYIMYVPT